MFCLSFIAQRVKFIPGEMAVPMVKPQENSETFWHLSRNGDVKVGGGTGMQKLGLRVGATT